MTLQDLIDLAKENGLDTAAEVMLDVGNGPGRLDVGDVEFTSSKIIIYVVV